MALAGIYIDDKNQCKPVDENGSKLPDAFAAEMKLYKLCNMSVDRQDDPDKVSKAVTAALAKWSADEGTNAKTMEEAKKKANEAFNKAKHEAQEQEKKELEQEDKRHETEKHNIDTSGMNPADKRAATDKENETHKKKRGDIIKKRTDAEAAAAKARDAAIAQAESGLIKPAALDVKCSVTDPCPKDCAPLSIYPDPSDNKKVKTGKPNLDNISHLSENHAYFCTCGKK